MKCAVESGFYLYDSNNEVSIEVKNAIKNFLGNAFQVLEIKISSKLNNLKSYYLNTNTSNLL